MKLLRECLIILVIYFVGEFISSTFKLSIPGNIIGMLLLLALLMTNRNSIKFLIRSFSILFLTSWGSTYNCSWNIKIRWYSISDYCYSIYFSGNECNSYISSILHKENEQR